MRRSQPFREIKRRLDGRVDRFECSPVQLAQDEVVLLHKRSEEGRVDDLVLPAGSLTFGYFWTQRPYNVYHFVTETGRTLGVYFNVCDQTEISPETVSWRDLVIDLLVTPDGRCRVLDAEELPPDLSTHPAQLIRETEQYLQSQHGSVCAEVERRTAAYLTNHIESK